MQFPSRAKSPFVGLAGTRRLAAVLCAFALLAGACSGSSASEVSAAGQSDESGDSYVPSDPEQTESFEDLDFSSPIAEFLGQDIGGFEFDEAAAIAQQREAETAIAACMIEKGFEYTPPDVSQMMSFGGPMGFDFDPGSPEWVETYGFGISTMRFPQSMVGDLVGMPDEGFGPPEIDFVDPNQEYVENLSEGERDAYYEALYGQQPEFGPEGPGEDFVFEPSGCQADAFMNGPGGGDANVREFYQAFNDDMESLYERVNSDSRIVSFNAKVSACVAEDGLTWTDQQGLYERFESRLNGLQQGQMGGEDPFEAAGVNPEEMSERELNDFFNELNRLSPEDLITLGEVQAEEIALAKAVMACGGGAVASQKVFQEVRVEYEQAFLDENAEALAEFAGD